MSDSYEDCRAAAQEITQRLAGRIPRTAVVLGSGLGLLTEQAESPVRIPYDEIPNFPRPTVASHKGEMVCGSLAGQPVLLLSGRFHHYEGFAFSQVVFPVRVLHLLGVKNLILTNAAGGVNHAFSVGDLMMITDQINLMACSPLAGAEDLRFGPRFFDMCDAYTHSLFPLVRSAAEEAGVVLREGTYFYMPGPQFETPAEIRAIRLLGGDAVGMSTVAEAMAAHQCGMKLIGLSFISNPAAGMTGQAVSDDEVVANSRQFAGGFAALVKNILCRLESPDVLP
ncbi:MAG: purine-nucleoside phosphorylase [Firmicutes bacterium]|nr:purine-nucleoside phosphorylase [Bacillota bacterium]